MTKISLQSLIRLLINNDQRFVIEKAKRWSSNDVLKFVTSPAYSDSFIINDPTEHASISRERFDQKALRGEIKLFYDMDHNCIVGCCNDWRQIIETEINRARNKTTKETSIVLASRVMQL